MLHIYLNKLKTLIEELKHAVSFVNDFKDVVNTIKSVNLKKVLIPMKLDKVFDMLEDLLPIHAMRSKRRSLFPV